MSRSQDATGRRLLEEPIEERDDAAVERSTAGLDREGLESLVNALSSENQRLRQQYARARRATYRRTALGLVAVGLVALVGAALFPAERTVLIGLTGIGVFAGVLTYYLTPERFIPAETGERVYASFAANVAHLVEELGLSDCRVYVPVEGPYPARLFIPQYTDYILPPQDALRATLVVRADTQQRGLSLVPSGTQLFEEFERTLTGPLGDTPEELVPQLSAAVVETFELAENVKTEVDPGGGRASFLVEGSAWGDIGRVDHPIVSLFAIGFAVGLDAPVELEVDADEDVLLILRWESDAARAADSGAEEAGGPEAANGPETATDIDADERA